MSQSKTLRGSLLTSLLVCFFSQTALSQEVYTDEFLVDLADSGKLKLPPINLTYNRSGSSLFEKFENASLGFDMYERFERTTAEFRIDDRAQKETFLENPAEGSQYFPFPLNLKQFRTYFEALIPGKSTPLRNQDRPKSVFLGVSKEEFVFFLERDTVFEYPADVFSLGITRKIEVSTSGPVFREFDEVGGKEDGEAYRLTIEYPIQPHDVNTLLNPFEEQSIAKLKNDERFGVTLSLTNLLIPVIMIENGDQDIPFSYRLMRAKIDFVNGDGFDGLLTVYAGEKDFLIRPFKRKRSRPGPFLTN